MNQFNRIRKHIFDIIEASDGENVLSSVYDYFIIIVIILSLIPLAFKQETTVLQIFDKVAVTVFIIDYILRWATADFKFQSSRAMSFIRYPASFMALIDLLSILPSLTVLNTAFKTLRILRMFRAFRVFRVLKTFRYSKNLQMVASVLKESKEPLLAVGSLAVIYILISGLIIYNVEPETFNSYFDAIYWASIVLTTIGIGDVCVTTGIGRLITMLSSFAGIAIVALPSGIITAGFMRKLYKRPDTEKEDTEEDSAEV